MKGREDGKGNEESDGIKPNYWEGEYETLPLAVDSQMLEWDESGVLP
jgi:hypothetical protein